MTNHERLERSQRQAMDRAVERARAELEKTFEAYTQWAAWVRQRREQALGSDTDEKMVLNALLADPTYGAALDHGAPIAAAIRALGEYRSPR